MIKKPFYKRTKQRGLLTIFSCMKLSLSSMHNKGFFRIFIDVEKRSDSWRLILIDGVTPSQVQIRYSFTMGSDLLWRTFECIFLISYSRVFFSLNRENIWKNKAGLIAKITNAMSYCGSCLFNSLVPKGQSNCIW